MNQEERELLKAELREEILTELSSKSPKIAPGLKKVYEKWFYGPDRRDKFKNSKMAEAFGFGPHWKTWETIRTFVRIHFDKSSQAQLASVNQDELERVADSVCQLIYSLKIEQNGKGVNKCQE